MRNIESWRPSKYVRSKRGLAASRDPSAVGVGSRLVGDLVARHYQEVVPQYASGRLVDLGCGKVPLFGLYRAYVSDVVCADWPGTRHVSDHVDLWCDLSRTLPFCNDAFDTALLSDVLEHVANPDRTWAELARVVRRGGRVLMNVPFLYCIHEAPHDYCRYTEYALRGFAERAGFDILYLVPVGGSAEVAADFLAKHLQFVPWLGRGMAAAVQGAAALLGRTQFGRRLSQSSGRAFPLGYILVAERRR